MSDLFVKFPGLAGNYISTPDVNLLDADTAHLQQSIGSWKHLLNTQNIALSSAVAPEFGDSVLVFESAAASVVIVQTATGVDAVSLPADDVAVSVRVMSPTGDALGLDWQLFTDAGANAGEGSFDSIPSPPAGEWVTLSGTLATAAGLRLAIRVSHSVSAADVPCYVDKVIIREGTDPTFVPSLRIVGSVRQELDVNIADWTPATIQSLMSNYGTGPDRGIAFYLMTDGTLQLYASFGTPASVVFGAVKERNRVGFTFDKDTGIVSWLKDGVEFDQTTLAPQAPIPGNVALNVGAADTGTDFNLLGDIYWSEVRDGIDGPVVARFDAQDVP